MAGTESRAATFGRVALALVRLVNGFLGLLLPGVLIARIDTADPSSPAAVYAFRLFGVRTILLGRDLLVRDAYVRAKAVQEAPLIHASDTATATPTIARSCADGRTTGSSRRSAPARSACS